MTITITLEHSWVCENSAPNVYECVYCNLSIDDGCLCVFDDSMRTMDLYCHQCNDIHEDVSTNRLLGLPEWDYDTEEVEIIDLDLDTELELMSVFKKKGVTEEFNVPKFSYHNKCRHYNVPFTTRAGVTVYASSAHDRKPSEAAPDFGLYLDGVWKPACLAYTLDWPDYGIPPKFDIAAKAIIDTYNKAIEGLWVEVGCIGGHGRTGTALACMAVLGGDTPKQAIKRVRKEYCEHTIETNEQEWFIEWFNIFVNGGELDYMVWDKKQKKMVVGKHFTFTTTFDWESYDTEAWPVGSPPEDIIETVHDIYVVVPVWDKKKHKWSYECVDHADEGFPAAYKAWKDQQNAEKAAKAQAAEAAAVEEALANSIAANQGDKA